MRWLRRIVFWLIVLDLTATALFWGVSRFMDQSKSLTGGTGVVFYTDNNKDAAARIAKAVNLLKAGKLDRLYMVGGHRPQEGWLGSQEMALIAARGSGLGGRISADVESRDTISGLKNLARNAKTRAPGEIVFVSNCMQVIRAKVIYNAQPDHQSQRHGRLPARRSQSDRYLAAGALRSRCLDSVCASRSLAGRDPGPSARGG
jgi:hypothetical protein